LTKNEVGEQALDSLENLEGILDMAPRTGKTKIAIEAIRHFPGKVLVTYPYNVIGEVWREELQKWNGPSLTLANQRNIPDEEFDLIICDEIHSLSEAQINRLKGSKILGLTGSLSEETAKILKQKLGLDVKYTYTIDQAIIDGIISNYQITVFFLPLDTKEKYVEAGTKKKPFLTTERVNYEYLTKQFNRFKYLSWQDPTLANVKMSFAGKRARGIYSYKSKLEAVKSFLRTLDERYMIFTVLNNIANELSEHRYHSKSEGDELDKFINGEFPSISVCNMVSMGRLKCPFN